MSRGVRALSLAFGLLVSGCATYSYNGGTYHSPDEAHAAQKQYQDQILSNISIISPPIPGSALVIVPSKSTIEALGVTRKGSPSKELIDYAVDSLASDYSYFPKYLGASKAFSNVETRVVDHTTQEARQAAGNYAATVYLQMLSPSQVGWFLLKPDSSTPIEIHFDGAAAAGAPKIDSWVKSIVEGVRSGGVSQ